MPAEAQPELREFFRRYVDARLAVYRLLPDVSAAQTEIARVNTLQGEIWLRATQICQQTPNALTAQVLPSLNEMFVIADTRTAAIQIHQPVVIFVMLGVLSLMSALLAGYAMAGGNPGAGFTSLVLRWCWP